MINMKPKVAQSLRRVHENRHTAEDITVLRTNNFGHKGNTAYSYMVIEEDAKCIYDLFQYDLDFLMVSLDPDEWNK